MALPTELSEEEQFEIGYNFAQDIADRYKVIAFINFHNLHTNNPHIDMMWSTREFDGKTFTKKTRVLDDIRAGPQEIKWLREQWAQRVNEKLQKYHLSIDHRSYKAQGSDKIPTKHMGRRITVLERKGIHTEIAAYNKKVANHNKLIDEKEKIDKEIQVLKTQMEQEEYESNTNKDGRQSRRNDEREYANPCIRERCETFERGDERIYKNTSIISDNAKTTPNFYGGSTKSIQPAGGRTLQHDRRNTQYAEPTFKWGSQTAQTNNGEFEQLFNKFRRANTYLGERQREIAEGLQNIGKITNSLAAFATLEELRYEISEKQNKDLEYESRCNEFGMQ